MFKYNRFKVIRAEKDETTADAPVWKEDYVTGMKMDVIGIQSVSINGNDVQIILGISAFVQEMTGSFDKSGTALFGGDIVTMPIAVDDADPVDMLFPIVFVEGAFCLVLENVDAPIYLISDNCKKMKKVGNIYQHGALIEKDIDEKIFEQKQSDETTNT